MGTRPPPGDVTLMLVGLSVPVGVQWKYRVEPARTRRPVRRGVWEEEVIGFELPVLR